MADSRKEMLEAVEAASESDEDQHGLRSLAALTEAVTEIQARLVHLETGPPQTGSHLFLQDDEQPPLPDIADWVDAALSTQKKPGVSS